MLVVAPRWLLHPGVPQPAGSLLYELVTGHPDGDPGEQVFPTDLGVELRAWAHRSWAARGADLDQLAAAMIACWRRGDPRGLAFPVDSDEEARAPVRRR